MKIVIVTLNTHGGMVHYVSQLANSLSKTQDVVVVAPTGVERTNFGQEVKIREIALGNTIKNLLLTTLIFTRTLAFVKAIHDENPDVIHINEHRNLWLAFLVPLLRRYPVVVTVHDVHPHAGSREFDQKIGLLCYSFLSDSLIVHGKRSKEELGVNKRSFIVPHGGYSFFLNSAKERNSLEKESGRCVLFFGRIEEYKGLNYLIDAMRLVSAKYPNMKLVVAGQGEFGKYQSSVMGNAVFEIHNRYIPDTEVPVFFQRAEIVVLPYTEGTQSGVVSIAYAFRKPVVATDVGDIPEVVDNGVTGFVVPPRDAQALAKAIIALLEDGDLRTELGENGYRKMRNELSWDAIAGKTIAVYRYAIDWHNNPGLQKR